MCRAARMMVVIVAVAAVSVQAGFIECTVYTYSNYRWIPVGSFTTDAINYPAPWYPYGLSTYSAQFVAPVRIAASGGQGFEWLRSGYYVGAGMGTLHWPHEGAYWSSPGHNPPIMQRSDGFGYAPGVYRFSYGVETHGQPAGAIVNWDAGVTYVPEPATLALLGGLALIRRRCTA